MDVKNKAGDIKCIDPKWFKYLHSSHLSQASATSWGPTVKPLDTKGGFPLLYRACHQNGLKMRTSAATLVGLVPSDCALGLEAHLLTWRLFFPSDNEVPKLVPILPLT